MIHKKEKKLTNLIVRKAGVLSGNLEAPPGAWNSSMESFFLSKDKKKAFPFLSSTPWIRIWRIRI
jgi:hypothetical protein